MVKVNKIAVWEVEDEIFRDVKSATNRARRAIIEELYDTERPSEEEVPEWIAGNWDKINQQVERAMAST